MKCKVKVGKVIIEGETRTPGEMVEIKDNHVAIYVERGHIVEPKEPYPSMRPKNIKTKAEREKEKAAGKRKKEISEEAEKLNAESKTKK